MATELKTLSPAARLAADRMDVAVERAIAGSPLYPNGTAFVGADLPDLGEVLATHARERRYVVIVYPDGEERLVGPWPSGDEVTGLLQRVRRWLSERGPRP